MVLPVIAAAGARVAGTTVARGAVSTVAKTGAQTAARGASTAARKGVESGGRNIVRTRRSPGTVASSNRTNPNVVRAKNSASGQVNNTPVTGRAQNSEDEYEEDFDENFAPTTPRQSVQYRIGYFVAFMLLLTAGLFDVTELVLDLAGTILGGVGVVIGVIKDAVSFVFFPVVFWALGAPFWKGRKAKKKVIAMVSAALISLVPWLGAFMPETVIAVAVTIFFTRVEDKGKTVEGSMESMNKNIVRAKRIAGRFR